MMRYLNKFKINVSELYENHDQPKCERSVAKTLKELLFKCSSLLSSLMTLFLQPCYNDYYTTTPVCLYRIVWEACVVETEFMFTTKQEEKIHNIETVNNKTVFIPRVGIL